MKEEKKNSKFMLANFGSVKEKTKIMNSSSSSSSSHSYPSSHKTTETGSPSSSISHKNDNEKEKTYSTTPTPLLFYTRRIVLPTIFGFEAYYYDENNKNISKRVNSSLRKVRKSSRCCYQKLRVCAWF